MESMKVRITLTEEMLGTASAKKDIHAEYIASKAPNAPSMEEEIAAIGVEEVTENAMTVFSRTPDGTPAMWDYQIKGFLKDTFGMLRKVPGSACSKIKAYKKEIDGLIFVSPRIIPISLSGEMGTCQRPLRAQTAQGERVALASSETVPAGSVMEFEFKFLTPGAHMDAVIECLEYATMRGFGQWRNSGKGTFLYEIIDNDGKVIGGNKVA